MSEIILLNDVESEMELNDVIVGNSDIPATIKGEKQSIEIAKYLIEKTGKVNTLCASPAQRLNKLLHQIRIHSEYLTSKTVRYSTALLERDFGVLTGSKYMKGFDSDLFTHTRIAAENGESIYQCNQRAMHFISSIYKKGSKQKILCVSHPFLCNIICNTVFNKSQTLLLHFWFRKGSFIISEFSTEQPSIRWDFIAAYNTLESKEYTLDEIYSDIVNE